MNETKKCKGCGIELPINEFCKWGIKKDGTLGYINYCQKCHYQRNKEKKKANNRKNYNYIKRGEYYVENKDKLIEYQKIYSKDHKEEINKRHRLWRCKNSDKQKKYINLYNKQWRIDNPEKTSAIDKRSSNSEKNKKYRLAYKKKQYKEKYGKDLKFTLPILLRNRLKIALKKEYKSGKTLELLGCSIEEFKIHLENQFDENMNWDNRGNYWEIDHIKPIALFDLTVPEQQKECFHYTNMQPLEKISNRIKYNKYE